MHSVHTHVASVAGQSIILLAEDCSDDVFFLQRALKTSGASHSVFRVCNGADCIAYLKGASPYDDRLKFPFPHLLLLDLKMPILSGVEVLQWIKQQPTLQTLPVIVLTASIFPEEQATCLSLGARAFYMKPNDPATLATLVKAIDSRWLSPQR